MLKNSSSSDTTTEVAVAQITTNLLQSAYVTLKGVGDAIYTDLFTVTSMGRLVVQVNTTEGCSTADDIKVRLVWPDGSPANSSFNYWQKLMDITITAAASTTITNFDLVECCWGGNDTKNEQGRDKPWSLLIPPNTKVQMYQASGVTTNERCHVAAMLFKPETMITYD
jgi:hypothetical protein